MSALSRRRLLQLGVLAPVAGLAAFSATNSEAQQQSPRASAVASPSAACAGTPSASPQASPGASPAAGVTIKMVKGLHFDPDHVTIKVGQTVTWINEGVVPHTTTCDPAANPVEKAHPEYIKLPAGAKTWNSGFLDPGKSFSHTFTVPGEYDYICIPHVLSGMRGQIIVEC
jgi:plastocyanin